MHPCKISFSNIYTHPLFAHKISKLKHSALQLGYVKHGLEVCIEDIKKLTKIVILAETLEEGV